MDKYYEILGIKPGASEKEIQEAYTVLAKVWQPDRFPNDPGMQEKANEKLKEINDAREKLLEFLRRPPEPQSEKMESDGKEVERRPREEPPSRSNADQKIPSDETGDAFKPKKRSKLGKHLKWAIPVVAVVIAAGVFGYLKVYAWNPERQKLATINERKITVAQFERELAKVPPPYQEVLREEPKEFLEQLVLKEVLLQEARRKGVKPDPEAKGEDADMSILQNLLKKEVVDKIEVSPQEIQEIYQQHKEEMGKKPLTEVGPMIENAVREAKGKEKTEQYVNSLRTQAKIEVDESRLKQIASAPPPTNTKDEFAQALKSGRPFLVDFGANSCMPCRQIRPILKEIEKEYTGKAQVLILDVYKNQDLAREYKVSLIPTLVFFDKTGKEVFRHVGAWDKSSIVAKLKEAGAA